MVALRFGPPQHTHLLRLSNGAQASFARGGALFSLRPMNIASLARLRQWINPRHSKATAPSPAPAKVHDERWPRFFVRAHVSLPRPMAFRAGTGCPTVNRVRLFRLGHD